MGFQFSSRERASPSLRDRSPPSFLELLGRCGRLEKRSLALLEGFLRIGRTCEPPPMASERTKMDMTARRLGVWIFEIRTVK
ncbi:hypothetical protein CRG98_042269 [Punica granatum]|uniref:Uncharacterized protein n=1 Tax=Punica granatum TaxID=22663 RepID=A0A2I0I035_PUNGR|nr:hypothetical protein CRG98_042269 [Punica granatum]